MAREINGLSYKNTARVYYRFSTGALTTDSGPNGKTLTNNNTCVDATGKFGGAVSTDSPNSSRFMSLDTNPCSALQPTNVTICFWIKMIAEITTGQVDVAAIETSTDATGFGANIRYSYNSGSPKITAYLNGTTTTASVDAVGALGTTDWHHIAIKKEAGKITLYKDGSNSGDSTIVGDLTSLADATYRLAILSNRGGASFASTFLIDDFMIIESALTDANILDIYSGLDGAGFLLNFI